MERMKFHTKLSVENHYAPKFGWIPSNSANKIQLTLNHIRKQCQKLIQKIPKGSHLLTLELSTFARPERDKILKFAQNFKYLFSIIQTLWSTLSSCVEQQCIYSSLSHWSRSLKLDSFPSALQMRYVAPPSIFQPFDHFQQGKGTSDQWNCDRM